MTVGAIGLFVGPDLDLTVQLRWAQQLAEARDSDLIMLEHVASSDRGIEEIPLDGSAKGDAAAAAREVIEAINSLPKLRAATPTALGEGESPVDDQKITNVSLKQVRCPDLPAIRELLLVEIRKSKLQLCTIVRKDLGAMDAEMVKERREFFRHVPCEIVLCSGFGNENDLTRILVAVASGPHGAAALRFGRELAASSNGSLTALRVNPNIGPDSERVGARRLDDLIRKSLGKESADVTRLVVVDGQVHRGVREVLREGRFDLVVTGASRVGILGSRIEGSLGAKLVKGDSKPTVAVVRAASPARNRFASMVESLIGRQIPQIDRENRIALVDRVQSSSNLDFDFLSLMVLATAIAAIGLIQNSAAVIIGAMLVAPLMTPILGLGLALVQGNPLLARISIRSIVFGVMVALSVGVVVGLLTPGFAEPTREMLGRGGPGVLDLLVAFVSGLAAAYASSRPGLLAALPGVAIAAALVPPIATSGLALSLGNFDLAFNALLLFVINMVAIVMATVVSLWLVGLRNVRKTSRWTIRAGGAVLLAVLVLGVYLSVRPSASPAATGIPKDLMPSIQQRLGDDFSLEGIAIAFDEIGVQLNVRVVGSTFATEGLADDIRSVTRSHFSKPVRVRMLTTVDPDSGSLAPKFD